MPFSYVCVSLDVYESYFMTHKFYNIIFYNIVDK